MREIINYITITMLFLYIFYELYRIYRHLDNIHKQLNILTAHLHFLDCTTQGNNPHHPQEHRNA